MAAAVVGIGLFLAPMEKAQAQFTGSGMGTVTQVDLDGFSFLVAGEVKMSFSYSFGSHLFLPVSYFSGIYGNSQSWEWKSIDGALQNYLDGYVVSPGFSQTQTPYFYPGNRGDYYVCRFGPVDSFSTDPGIFIDEDEGWIEIWVWTGTATDSPSAFVYDSEGNFYYPILTIK